MTIQHLTEMQYSTDRRGPFALYIYNTNGYHSGPQYFAKKIKYPREEITITQAHEKALTAISLRREVRITDPGDMLVFHSENGKIIYPEDAAKFWKEIGLES